MNKRYKYRNLPCTAGEWYVSGEDDYTFSGGVLEWCYDQKDAEERMIIMGQYSQFTNLKVGLWVETKSSRE